MPDPKTDRPFLSALSNDRPEPLSATDAEFLQAEKRWVREQHRAKLPFLVVALALLGCAVLYGLFAYDENPRHRGGDWLFIGGYGLIVTLLWFFFGTADWSHPWRQLRQGYWRGLKQAFFPIGQQGLSLSSPDLKTKESEDGLPTSFSGWLQAVAVAGTLIWFLVSLAWQACQSILK